MTTRTRWALTAMAGLLLSAPSVAQAQSSTTVSDEADREARAHEMVVKAEEASQDINSFREAAFLYRQAAETLGDHPESAHNLVQAGRLAYYTGREGQAIDDFEAAGESALAWGDVVTAAESFLDAAWVAAGENRGSEALTLARRAEKLSSSPLIQRQERVALLSRIADLQQQQQQD
jgi:hypothetical protein